MKTGLFFVCPSAGGAAAAPSGPLDAAAAGGRALAALIALTLALGAAQVFTIGAGLAGLPLGPWLARAILAGSLLVGSCAWRFCRVPRAAPEAPAGPRLRGVGLVLPAAAAGAWLTAAWWAWGMIDFSVDGNIYHIPAMHAWAFHGGVHWVREPYQALKYINGYPKGWEVFAYLLATATEHSGPVNMVNLLLAPLGALAVLTTARLWGASRSAAGAAAGCWPLIPVNLTQAPTTYVDAGFAACVAAGVALLAAALRAETLSWRQQRLLAPALGAAWGLALAVKPSALTLVGLMLLLGGARWLALCSAARRGALKFFFLAAVAAGLVGGYWYARNLVYAGSPLYPVGVRLGGWTLFPGESVAAAIRQEGNTPPLLRERSPVQRVMLTWLQTPGRWPRSITGQEERLGGLGYLWLLACVPSVLWTAGRAWRQRDAELLLLLGVVAAGFVLTPMNWWARYTVWIYSAGLPCLALALDAVLGRDAGGRTARWWLVACLAVALLEAGLCLLQLRGLSRRWTLDNSLAARVVGELVAAPVPVALGPLRSAVPGTIKVKAELIGYLCYPLGRRLIVPLSETAAETELAALRAHGVETVLWDETLPLPPALRAAARRESARLGVIVLRL